MKKKTLLLIAMVSLMLAGGCFYAATRYVDLLARKKLYAPVVKVAKGKEIAPFEPITRDQIVLEQEDADDIQEGAARTIEEVLGKRSVQTMFAGEQILAKKLENGSLLPGRGKARYEFPLTAMMPITELRKGDFVKLWLRYKPQTELASMPQPVHFRKMDNSAELLFESQLVTVKDSNGIEIYTLQPQLVPVDAAQAGNLLFHGSEAAKHVDGERRYRDYRAQPSAVPAYVGFNLTDEQYLILAEAMQYGTIQIGHVLAKEGQGF